MKAPPLLTIHTDGASRGNPGAAAFGYVIERDGAEPIEEAGCLGELTNNQAEYTALVRALRHALELGPQHNLLVLSDSELMVKQMLGEYRVKNADLLPLYEDARALVKRFQGTVTFQHVRRGANGRADALCNEALDGKRKGTRPAVTKPGPSAKSSPLRAEVVACLKQAAIAWAGDEDGPSPEELWEQIAGILKQHSVELP
jgi:ribonuclease HI